MAIAVEGETAGRDAGGRQQAGNSICEKSVKFWILNEEPKQHGVKEKRRKTAEEQVCKETADEERRSHNTLKVLSGRTVRKWAVLKDHVKQVGDLWMTTRGSCLLHREVQEEAF